MTHRKFCSSVSWKQAEWIIMPKAIDLIANGKVKVDVIGKAIVEEN